jgi:tetratricopeptide (TPR) repeat protein
VTVTEASRDLDGLTLLGDVLGAYRQDLARTPDVACFGAHDARWLRTALQVEQLVSQPARGDAQRLRRLAAHPTLRGRRLLALAEQMEAAGALMLAFATLASARRVWERTDPASCGTAIFRQARICRTVGATRAAENYYSLLASYAQRHRLSELRGRALIGFGLLRLVEGNPAAGRRWFVKARSASGNHPVACAVSFHAEMNAALALRDHSGALIAGSRALAGNVLPRYDEAGVLINIASLALRAGHPAAALATVRRAIRRSTHPRVRLIAYSKGAAAAAALARPALVNRFAAQLMGVAAHVCVPFEEMEARSELAEALAEVGERERARRMARSVRAEAQRHRFAAIVHRCDRLLRDVRPEPERLPLTVAARRVIEELVTV